MEEDWLARGVRCGVMNRELEWEKLVEGFCVSVEACLTCWRGDGDGRELDDVVG